MTRLRIRLVLFIFLAVTCSGCQNLYLQPDDIEAIRPPAVNLAGRATIRLTTGEVVTDRYPAKGFGAEDQRAFVTHLQEELLSASAFTDVSLNHDTGLDYLIAILFNKTEAAGSGFEGIYRLDVELQLYDHQQLSLQKRYAVLTPENRLAAFFADGTIRATKARAANELHRRLMEDLNGWLLAAAADKRKREHRSGRGAEL